MILGGTLIELYDVIDLEIISVRSIFDIRLYEALLLIFPRLIEKMVKKKKWRKSISSNGARIKNPCFNIDDLLIEY